jgi:hypothetical protein
VRESASQVHINGLLNEILNDFLLSVPQQTVINPKQEGDCCNTIFIKISDYPGLAVCFKCLITMRAERATVLSGTPALSAEAKQAVPILTQMYLLSAAFTTNHFRTANLHPTNSILTFWLYFFPQRSYYH